MKTKTTTTKVKMTTTWPMLSLAFGSTMVLIASLFFVGEVNSKPVDYFQTTTTIAKNTREGITIAAIDLLSSIDNDGGTDADADADADYDGITIPDFASRIVGGDQAAQGEFPYFVETRYGGGCGGVLIANDWVLTAAHCGNVQGNYMNIGAYRSAKNENQINEPQKRKCVKYIEHSNFRCGYYTTKFEKCGKKKIPPFINDFALCKLNAPVTVDTSKVTFGLNFDTKFPAAGSDVTAIGFGQIDKTPGSHPSILRKVVNQVNSNTVCVNNHGDGFIKPENICASVPKGGKGVCIGDSGGPLVFIKKDPNDGTKSIHTIVGVTSWGRFPCGRKSGGVFQRVSSGEEFILGNICDDDYNNQSPLCKPPTDPQAPAPVPPTPVPPIMSPTTSSPTLHPTISQVPVFENLGKGYCRDSIGNYNEANWNTKSACVGVTRCEKECKDTDQCIGISWASEPSNNNDFCRNNSLPRCVVYYGAVVAIEKTSSVTFEEYTCYRYGKPAVVPTDAPTNAPTNAPTASPTNAPTDVPTNTPTNAPTNVPTNAPTNVPTDAPTNAPTNTPTNAPTTTPTATPTTSPTTKPTHVPSGLPSIVPLFGPSTNPSSVPSVVPTWEPTAFPTDSKTLTSEPTVFNDVINFSTAPSATLCVDKGVDQEGEITLVNGKQKTCAKIRKKVLCQREVENQKGTLAEDLCPVACSVGTCNFQLDLCADKSGKIRVRGKGKKTCAQCKKKGLCQREVENEKGKFVENSCPTACSLVNSVVNCRDPPPNSCIDDTEFKYKCGTA